MGQRYKKTWKWVSGLLSLCLIWAVSLPAPTAASAAEPVAVVAEAVPAAEAAAISDGDPEPVSDAAAGEPAEVDLPTEAVATEAASAEAAPEMVSAPEPAASDTADAADSPAALLPAGSGVPAGETPLNDEVPVPVEPDGPDADMPAPDSETDDPDAGSESTTTTGTSAGGTTSPGSATSAGSTTSTSDVKTSGEKTTAGSTADAGSATTASSTAATVSTTAGGTTAQKPFAELTPAEQMERIYALGGDEAAAEALLRTLNETQKKALSAYAQSLAPSGADSGLASDIESIPPAVNYLTAGPYLGALTAKRPADIQPSSARRRVRRSADTQRETVYENGIGLAKSVVSAPGADNPTLRLEAFTSGTVTSTTVAVPLDIMLVLDVSGSMAWNFAGSGSDNERYNAMKTAVENFIDQIQQNAETANVTHRVGIVSFSSNAQTVAGMTPLQTEADASGLKGIFNGNLPSASGATNIDRGIDRGLSILNAADPTWNVPAGITRGRVVVVFTDGYPTTNNGFELPVSNRALASINAAKNSGATVYTIGIFGGANPEQMYGSSGFATNANGSAGSRWFNYKTGGSPDNDQWSVVQVPAANRFMNLLSSNVSSASSIGLDVYERHWHTGFWIFGTNHYEYGYTITQAYSKNKSGYYLSADNAAALNDAFQSIASSLATPAIELPANTTEIRDILSDQFLLPDGFDASSVRLSTYECIGQDAEGNWAFSDTPNPAPDAHLAGVTVTADVQTKTIKINGYNYNDNYVTADPKTAGGTDRGRKLVIEFEIQRDPTFFGGNGVLTNNQSSGIYNTETDQPYMTFPQPSANLSLQYDFNVVNQAIYLGNQVNLGQAITFANGPVSFRPNGVNNAYVDIRYELYDGSTLMGAYTVPAGTDLTGSGLGQWVVADQRPLRNQMYQVQVTVTPSIADPAGYGPTVVGPKNIYVQIYRPKVQAEDTEIYWGETLDMRPLYTTQIDSGTGQPLQPTKLSVTEWVADTSGSVPGGIGAPVDAPPAVIFDTPDKLTAPPAYSPAAFAPDADTPFKARVKLSADPSLNLPDIEIEETSADGREAAPGSEFDFDIRLKYASLTLRKTGQITDPNQSFIFTVDGPAGKNLSWAVAVQGAGSKTITGLPVGAYTVTEQTEWSWRYTPDEVSRTAQLTPAAPNQAVTFQNTRTTDDWLSGDNAAVNVFTAPNQP